MKRIWKLHADVRKSCFTWYQHLLWFIHFSAFKIWYCKRQYVYRFLPFGFINVIVFVVNSFGSYSPFVGADLEYPNSLCHDRSRRSGLTYFNFEPSLKLWHAQDFDRSQITVTLGGFQDFSRFLNFENFKTLSFCVCHHYHHYIQYELLRIY